MWEIDNIENGDTMVSPDIWYFMYNKCNTSIFPPERLRWGHKIPLAVLLDKNTDKVYLKVNMTFFFGF